MKEKWIWVNNDQTEKDSYAEFISKFIAPEGKVELTIACDSVYNVEINGELAVFGACADYPQRKTYDRVDITKYCKAENEVKITVWYFGESSSTYKRGERGLAFRIFQGENTLLRSDENVLSRKNINYKNGYCKWITGQMGYSYFYDNTVANNLPFEKSVVNGEVTAQPKDRSVCELVGRLPVTLSKIDGGYRIDWGREAVGFLELDFVSPKAQKLTISFGEHLETGKVSRFIGTRDFSVEFVAKEGKNTYRNALRRLAGRYLDIECEEEIDIAYIGLNEVVYPLTVKPRTFKDELSQKIYDTCIHTLRCCMHEHYEDCPWREQGQYTMDSRNQMLCGYYAFEGTDFQASALRLIADGMREDDLLDICFPSEVPFTIPFFSLIFPIQLYEYSLYGQDKTVVEELVPVARRILKRFAGCIDEKGLIPAFEKHWNFYEWTDGSDFGDELEGRRERSLHYDLILNCAYVHACNIFEKLTGESTDNTALKKAIVSTFYDEERGLFKLCECGDGEKKFSKLGNAFAYLIGLGTDGFIERLKGDDLVEVSLSMRAFYYDALLMADKANMAYVIEDIKARYKKMLDVGATTFWETELGWVDFEYAGSLCHGWSALPVYYLLMNEENKA